MYGIYVGTMFISLTNHLRVFLNLLPVYYINHQNTQGNKRDLPWAVADAAFIQCVVNAADRKAARTFSSYFEKSIMAEKEDKEKDECRHLMGLLPLVSLALNNVENPECMPSLDLIPFIEWIKWDETFPDPIHCVAGIMFGMAKNEVSSKGHSNQIHRLRI